MPRNENYENYVRGENILQYMSHEAKANKELLMGVTWFFVTIEVNVRILSILRQPRSSYFDPGVDFMKHLSQ